MSILVSLIAVLLLAGIAWVGVEGLGLATVFGVVIPYAAIVLFLVGIVWRVVSWARTPVPFRITTTTGQQKSLDWIRHSPLEAPATRWQAFWRMVGEIVLFRSLFRNTRSELRGDKLVYGSSKWLWLIGLLFHYSFLIIFLRHFKYFVEPVPGFVEALQSVDGFFQVGLPIIYITDAVFLVAVTWLFVRRVVDPRLRYLSLSNDYFPLFLLLGIGVTGVLMRYFIKVDITSVKALGAGLLTFTPAVPEVGALFYIHLFLVMSLIAYFPFSKLVHAPGVFMSPTRNMPNDNRARRHVNPWNPKVKVHTYDEYEDEFRQLMAAAGLPTEKPFKPEDNGGEAGKEE